MNAINAEYLEVMSNLFINHMLLDSYNEFNSDEDVISEYDYDSETEEAKKILKRAVIDMMRNNFSYKEILDELKYENFDELETISKSKSEKAISETKKLIYKMKERI